MFYNCLMQPTPPHSTLHSQGFNGADLRNICTEAGMFAIRDERDYVIHEDYMKVRHPGVVHVLMS